MVTTTTVASDYEYLILAKVSSSLINYMPNLDLTEQYSNSRVHLMFDGESRASFMFKSVTINNIKAGKAMQESIDNVKLRATAASKQAIEHACKAKGISYSALTFEDDDEFDGELEIGPPKVKKSKGKKQPKKHQIAVPDTAGPDYDSALDDMIGLSTDDDQPNSFESLVGNVDIGDIFQFEDDQPMYAMLGISDGMALCVHAQQKELDMYFVIAFGPDMDIDELLGSDHLLYQYLNFKKWHGNTMTVKVLPSHAEHKLICYSAYAGTVAQMAKFETPLPLLSDIETSMEEAVNGDD